MGAVSLKGDWRSAITISGELFVMISLILTVLMLHAGSLDTQTQVHCNCSLLQRNASFIDQNTYSMYSIGAVVRAQAFFGQGSGSIVLDNVACTGSEPTLLTCRSNPIGINNCDHSEDVGVVCQPRPPSEIYIIVLMSPVTN